MTQSKGFKKLATKLFLLVILLIGLVVLKEILTPFYWGRDRMARKVEYLLETPIRYNTLLMGSSKVDCNFDPVVFDKNTAATKTFNLGCNGSTMDENFYILKNLLPKLQNIDQIFFQVTRPRLMAMQEMQTIESRYYLDWNITQMLISYFEGQENRKTIYHKYLKNLLSFGEWTKRLTYKFRLKKINKTAPPLKITHGLYNTLLENTDWAIKGQKKRSDPRLVNILNSQLIDYQQMETREYEITGPVLAWCNEINSMCKAHNIECIFFSMPMENYKLPDNLNYIYMGDGPDHKDYFQLANHLDHVHVTKDGAEIYSRVLAEEFSALKLN